MPNEIADLARSLESDCFMVSVPFVDRVSAPPLGFQAGLRDYGSQYRAVLELSGLRKSIAGRIEARQLYRKKLLG